MIKRFVITSLFLAIVAGCGAPATSTPAPPDKSAAPVTIVPAASAKPAAGPAVLLDIAGSGAKKTQVFSAKGSYDLSWTAKDASGYGCYLGITIYDSSSNTLAGLAVNQQVPAGGQKSDVDHEHKGGSFYLDINAASCDWTVKVTG